MIKPKAIIFGAGPNGISLLSSIQKQYDVVSFLDNDKNKWSETITDSNGNIFYVLGPQKITSTEYDMVVIASNTGLEPMTKQLLDMGVERFKIDRSFIAASIESRIKFLENVGQMINENALTGCVAEGGVFQGEYAKEINRVFSNRTLYLFDTFEGFDARDIGIETNKGYSQSKAGLFNITTEDLVINKLPHPDKCIIRKGYFPETTKGIDEEFCFVNLDFDLYQPILSGLKYFVPRMTPGGIILIDDYFSGGYKGVKDAVNHYQNKNRKLQLFPIGDGNSIGVLL